MSDVKLKFLLFLAWPILAFALAIAVVAACVVALVTLAVIWPLIPFMTVTEKKGGVLNISWKRA